MKKRLILTNPESVIYDPDARPPRRVPAEGVLVDTSKPFWRRRMKDGDMREAPPAAPVEPAKTTSKPAITEA